MPTPTQIPPSAPKKPEASALTKVATKISASAQATKIGQKIFSASGQSNVSPTDIKNLFRSAGINIPKEMTVSLDSAQVLITGGAFYTAVSKADSISQVLKPSVGVLNAVTSLLGELGLFDKNSFGAKWLDVGTAALCLLAVPGLNVLAAIGLAVKVIIELIFPPDERPEVRSRLERQSADELQTWWKEEINKNKRVIMQSQLALADGKVSPFQMLANIATEAPILFPYFVPEMNAFLPPQNFSACIYKEEDARHGGFLGLFRQTERVKTKICHEYKKIQVTGKEQLAEAFIRAYVYEPFAPYFLINQMPESVLQTYGYPEKSRSIGVEAHRNPVYPRISVNDLALLSMFAPFFQRIEDDFDITDFLNRLRITPSELGYNILEKELGYLGYFGEEKTLKLPAISFNGVDYFDPSVRAYNSRVQVGNDTIKKALEADRLGDAKTLYNLWPAVKILQEWGVLPYVTPEMSRLIPNLEVRNPALQKTDYRNIQNVWACYSMINTLRQDPFFQDCLYKFDFLGSMVQDAENVEKRYNEIYYHMIAKQMNQQAKTRLSKIVGVPEKDLVVRQKENGLSYVEGI